MKTTLDLPDELMRTIKIRAAREDRKLKDLIAELLRQGLEAEMTKAKSEKGRRVVFPLIHNSHPAPPGQELTPERIHEILLEEEVERHLPR